MRLSHFNQHHTTNIFLCSTSFLMSAQTNPTLTRIKKKKKKTVGGFPYSFLTSKSKVNNHAASTQTNMEGRSNRWLPENHFGGPGPLTAYVNLRFVYAAFLSTVFVWPECFLLPLAGGFLLCPWRFLYLKQYNLGSRRWRRN